MSGYTWHYTRGGPKPWRCGAMTGSATSIPAMTTCEDCIDLLNGGSDLQPPLHATPYMNDNEDGIFTFTDRNLGAGYTMEVVPQNTGNVEITVSWPTLGGLADDGRKFMLSHLDRMDLVRALLHDFHYSPERGGPNGID